SDFDRVPRAGYDTVVLNSVVQLFPGIHYLFEVLSAAVASIDGPGHVFIGDVRHYGLVEAFHLSVQLHQLAPETPSSELVSRVAQKIRSEAELLIDPAWFLALPERLPRITRVEVMPKEGEYTNEMSAFRYDVVLGVDVPARPAPEVLWLDYPEGGVGWEEIQSRVVE